MICLLFLVALVLVIGTLVGSIVLIIVLTTRSSRRPPEPEDDDRDWKRFDDRDANPYRNRDDDRD